MKRNLRPKTQFLLTIVYASLASIALFLYGAWRNESWNDSYLLWNLFLAWLPLLFAAWLVRILQDHRWSSWYAMGVSMLWLLFLPNSFYIVSDLIHLVEGPRTDLLYDTVMFTSFIFVGFALGISSLFLVHRQFRRRFDWLGSVIWLSTIFLLCGFAIYLGRDLRWNSWDVFANPGGLLFDISDRLLHPKAYPQMFVTTASFAVLIGSMYSVAYRLTMLLRGINKS